MADIGAAYLADAKESFQKIKKAIDDAVAQVSDDSFFATPGGEVNSIAVTMKHMAGNLRSRFTDFLTSDGEKPDRNRDGEFEVSGNESRRDIDVQWRRGWEALFKALDGLDSENVLTTVHIRGEPHTVLQALHRQMTHHSYHSGQIVLLAKYYAGDKWKTLSIPRNRSAEFNAKMAGGR